MGERFVKDTMFGSKGLPMWNDIMAYRMVTWLMTPRTWPWKVKLLTPHPDTLRARISRKQLYLGTPFQRTTNRKWHMGYQIVTWPMSLKHVLSQGVVRQYGRLSQLGFLFSDDV